MNEIDKFVERYNEYLKVKALIFDDVKFIVKNVEQNGFPNSIGYFLNTFSFPSTYNYSGFCFIGELGVTMELGEDYIHFATHEGYNMLYAYCFIDDCVYLLAREEHWKCSISLPAFFDAMSEVMVSKIKMVRDKTFELNPQYLKDVYYRCMEINGNDLGCSVFYEHVLGILE